MQQRSTNEDCSSVPHPFFAVSWVDSHVTRIVASNYSKTKSGKCSEALGLLLFFDKKAILNSQFSFQNHIQPTNLYMLIPWYSHYREALRQNFKVFDFIFESQEIVLDLDLGLDLHLKLKQEIDILNQVFNIM